MKLWKLSKSDREDSQGFSLWILPWAPYKRIGAVFFHWWKNTRWDYKTSTCKNTLPGFLLRIDIGPGAGYIGGRTAYLGLNVRGGSKLYGQTRTAVGFTRNANTVPYGFR